MYNVSQEFLNTVKNNDRIISGKLLIGDVELTDEDLISMQMEYLLSNNGIPSIGGVVASKIQVQIFKTNAPSILTTQELKPYIGLQLPIGEIEYVPMGVFRIYPKSIVETEKTISFTGYDILYILGDSPYETDLVFPATWNQIRNDLEKKGLVFANQQLNNVVVKEKPNTIRELLSIIAQLLARNCITNRFGEIEFREIKDVDFKFDNHRSFKLLSEDQVVFSKLKVQNSNEETFEYGNDNGYTITLKNTSITSQSELKIVYDRLFPFSYVAYECEVKGYPHLDLGDIITIVDHDVERKVIVAYHKLTYKGGLKSELKAEAPQDSDVSSGTSNATSIVQSLNNLRINLLEVYNVLADKVSVNQLQALKARIEELEAIDLTAIEAYIHHLETLELEAAIANIQRLESTIADINHLLAGNLDAKNLKAGLITATSGLIADLAITNAMIANVSADKINAGSINTNKVTIKSESGNLILADNTIQIKDGTRVRVQIGKDASGDYNMYIWDSEGNLMFDAAGLTEDGIKRAIIRNDMIANDANIDASKININSVITAINNGVTKIESSSILYNGKQLNVAFNELETGLQDYTNQKTQEAIDNIQIGGRNLASKNNIGKWISGWVEDNYVYTITGPTAGLYIKADVFKTGERYVLTFKAKKISGTVTSLAGHCANYTIHKVIRDGVLQSTNWVSGLNNPYPDDEEVHDYEIHFTAKDFTESDNNFYIQPNRPLYGLNYVMEIWDLMLVRGNKATDWTPAPEDIQAEIETRVKTTDFQIEQGRISALISEVESIEGQVNNTNQKVSSLEQTVNGFSQTVSQLQTDVNTTKSNLSQLTQDVNSFKTTVSSTYATKEEFNNLMIGGRNLARIQDYSHDNQYQTVTKTDETFNGQPVYRAIKKTSSTPPIGIRSITIRKGETFTASIWVKHEQQPTVRPARLIFYKDVILASAYAKNNYGEWERLIVTYTNNTDADLENVAINFYPAVGAGDVTYFTCPQIERGNKATDWTPAPEDVENFTIEQINTAKSELEVSINGINSRVTNVENTITTLDTRLTSAEQKITPEAIINTVEEKVSEGGTIIAQKSDITQTMDEWVAKFDYLKSGIKARYTRTTITIRAAGTPAFMEITVNDVHGNNVALNKTVTSNRSNFSSGELKNYVDGEMNQGVIFGLLSSGSSVWCQVDLGQVYEITSIQDIVANTFGEWDYKLEVSMDNENWTTVHEEKNTTTPTQNIVFSGFKQGITTINAEGVKVEHSGSNEWSMIRHDGFIRKWPYGEAAYLNDIYIAEYTTAGFRTDNFDDIAYMPNIYIPLPIRFAYRENIQAFVVPVDMFFWGNNTDSRGNLTYINEYSRIELEVVDYWLNSTHPEIEVKAKMYARMSDKALNWRSTFEVSDFTFLLIVIGY